MSFKSQKSPNGNQSLDLINLAKQLITTAMEDLKNDQRLHDNRVVMTLRSDILDLGCVIEKLEELDYKIERKKK